MPIVLHTERFKRLRKKEKIETKSTIYTLFFY